MNLAEIASGVRRTKREIRTNNIMMISKYHHYRIDICYYIKAAEQISTKKLSVKRYSNFSWKSVELSFLQVFNE